MPVLLFSAYQLLLILSQEKIDGDLVMLSTEEQKKICAQYKKKVNGKVQCRDCPLVISINDLMCHANSHYDPVLCDFVVDDYNDEDKDK